MENYHPLIQNKPSVIKFNYMLKGDLSKSSINFCVQSILKITKNKKTHNKNKKINFIVFCFVVLL